MATYSSNTTLKYGGTVSGGGAVPANSYAIASYTCTSTTAAGGTTIYSPTAFVVIHYAAGATVPSTFTSVVGRDASTTYSATYTLLTPAPYLVNTP